MFEVTEEEYAELLQVAKRVRQKYTRIPPEELLHQTIGELIEKGAAEKIRFPGFMYRAMTFVAMHNGQKVQRRVIFSLTERMPFMQGEADYIDYLEDTTVNVDQDVVNSLAAQEFLENSLHAQARYLKECGYTQEEIAKQLNRSCIWVSRSLVTAHWINGELCFRCPSCLTIRKNMWGSYFCEECCEKLNPQIRKKRAVEQRKVKPATTPKVKRISPTSQGVDRSGKTALSSAISRCKNPKLRQKYLEKLEKINAAAD